MHTRYAMLLALLSILVAVLGPAWVSPSALQADDAVTEADDGSAAPEPADAVDEEQGDDDDGDDADDDDDDDDEAGALPETLRAAALDSLVIVETWYKKDVTESADVTERDWRVAHIYSDFVDKKRPSVFVGAVLDDRGRVLMDNDGVEQRFVDRVVVRDVAGNEYPATREALLVDTTGLVLRIDADALEGVKPLRFAELENEGVDTVLRGVTLARQDDQWRLVFSSLGGSIRFARGEIDNVFYDFAGLSTRQQFYRSDVLGAVAVVANEDGEPVGVATYGQFDLNETRSVWKGPSLGKAERITVEQLTRRKNDIRGKLTPAVFEVVMKMRSGGSDDSFGGYGPGGFGSSGGASGEELTVFGIAISPTDVLVPHRLERRQAALIDKIFLKRPTGRRTRVDFVGAYKDVSAFVVRLPKGELPARVQLARDDLRRMKPFLVGTFRKKFGRNYLDLAVNRLDGKQRGYAGKYHWTALRNIDDGAVLLDMEGRLAGLFLQERIENEEAKRLERSGRGYYGREVAETRVFPVSELRPELTRPGEHMDAKIVVKPPQLAKRRAWFGVEYVPITKDLAEQLKVEKPTKDGQIGFIVNEVYDDSPAARLGLEVGDILLKAQSPGLPYPIELQAGYAGGGGWGPSRWWPGGGGGDSGMGPAEAIWGSRENFITKALDAIGVGKKITLTFHHPDGKGGGETKTAEYTIELAPPDQESAPKWQNRKLGLTVKDMTYEVRAAMNLDANAPGVVLAKVEPGSPTLVAKIWPNEIITRLGETPLTSAKQMRDLVAAAKADGQDKVRLTILRLGKTRFADLAVDQYDPADDEGIEEDEDQ